MSSQRKKKRRRNDGRVKERTIEGFIIKRVSTHDNASLIMTRHSVFFPQVGATPKRHVYVLFDNPPFFEVLHSTIISDFGLLFRFTAPPSNPQSHAIPRHPLTGNIRCSLHPPTTHKASSLSPHGLRAVAEGSKFRPFPFPCSPRDKT